MPPDAFIEPVLNETENRVMIHLGEAWDEYLKLDQTINNEQTEFMLAIHNAQAIILSRPTLRCIAKERKTT